MSEQANEPFDAVAAFESILADSDGATATHENHETDEAEADEAEAHDEPEDDASDESDAEGESNEEDAETGEASEADQMVTVKIDGKSKQIPLKEALDQYQQNFSYTQKSQALSEERKAFQAEQESIREERARYAQLLGALEQQVGQFTAQEPNWEYLRQNDPQTYVLAKMEWNELREKQAAIRSEQERLAYEEQVQQVQTFKATVANERELLLQKHPEFKNEKIWAKAKEDILAYGRDVMGFSEEELKSATDHRAVSSLYEAAKAHKARNTKGEPAKSSSARIPVGAVSATPRKPNALETAQKRLSKSGKTSDAAEVFRHLL